MTEICSNWQRISGAESKTGNQGTALSFSLSTSRMKFLEDSSMDPSLGADTGKGSRATEGKGLRKSLPFALSDTSHTCQAHSCVFLATVLFLGGVGCCVCGLCYLLGSSGHKVNLESKKAARV